MPDTVLVMFCSALTNVTLCAPAGSDIARCGGVMPVALPSIQISHGGLLDTISVPLPPSPFGAAAFGASSAGASAFGESKPGATMPPTGPDDFFACETWETRAGAFGVSAFAGAPQIAKAISRK